MKQGAEQQQISLSFRLEGLKESEMNAKCKQQHSLSAGALLLASKPSIQVVKFFLRVNAHAPWVSLGRVEGGRGLLE